VLDDQHARRREPRGRFEKNRLVGTGVVGRIDNHQVVRPDAVAGADADEIVPDDNTRVRGRAGGDVLAQHLQRAAVALDKGHRRRAATERLEPDGARARVAVEHPRPLDP
jgi:hypothetical protein